MTIIQDKLAHLVPPCIPRLTLHPGVDLALFKSQTPDLRLRASLGVAASERVIVYQGGINSFVQEDVRNLYLAVGWLNRQGYACRLIRTGPGRPPFLERLPARCREHILDLGYVKRERLPELLALADVCVQPGRFSTFNDLRLPSKIPEWLAMARPVLLPAANIATLLEDGVNCLLLQEGTPQDIAARCAWLFDHPEQAQEIGQRGRQFAEQHFSLPEQAGLLAKFYQRIAAEALSVDIRRTILTGIHPAAPPALFAFRKLRYLMQQFTDDSAAQTLTQLTLQRLDTTLSRWESTPLTAPSRYFNLQIYADWGQGFSESHTLRKSGVIGQGTCLRLQFPGDWEASDRSLTLRLDPHDGMALVEINAIRLYRCDDNILLWSLNDASVADLTIGGDALPLRGVAPLTLMSLGVDPWVMLPTLIGVSPATVRVELALQVTDSQERLRDGFLWLARERNEAQESLALAEARETALADGLALQRQALAQAEDREAALANETALQRQALIQAEDREAALTGELATQQQALAQVETHKAALEAELIQGQQALIQAEDREAALTGELATQQQALAQVETHKAALEAELIQGQQALIQAEDRETALTDELAAQRQALDAVLTQHNALNQALQQREDLIKTCSADMRLLVRLFEALQQDIHLAFESLTWRLGYTIAEVGRWLTFRKRIPLVNDHVAHLVKTYRSWRETTTSLEPPILTMTTEQSPIASISEAILTDSSDFDETAYLDLYPDVRAAVECGAFKSGREHWEQLGRQEIATGKRRTLKKFKPQIITDQDIKNLQRKIARWPRHPLISIIMPVYNVESRWLEAAIESVRKQIYPHWQLCIADDCSTRKETLDYLRGLQDEKIKIVFLEENQGIAVASNAALSLATGDFIALMDNDDELTLDALYEITKVINAHDPDLIYSDEDKLSIDGVLVEPHFKPDYSPDLLMSQNYICHLSVFRKALLDRIDGFRVNYEGAQDYDLILRFLDHTDCIFHISKVLYHWRKIPGSTAAQFKSKNHAWEAGRAALEDTLKRRNIQGEALLGKYPGTYRVRRTLLGEPKISIIIPFKDHPELLSDCLDSILKKTTYKNFEVIGVSNNSTEPETFTLMDRYSTRDSRIRFITYDNPFNFSAINNYAVKLTHGEHLILLNNDITVISPDWIEALLEHSQRLEVGAVGAKLYYPDDTLQHGGVIVGLGGVAGHSHKYFDREAPGYFFRLNLIQNLSAVTAACLMVKRNLYEEVGGLNEKDLTIAFNDIDFCLRLRERNYLNIFTPYCEMYHHESKSRGQEDAPEKQRRFAGEINYMRKRYAKFLESGDPYYNPNLTLDSEDFDFA
ncbi:MAG: glycosyltransferase [Gammaproteobacteria bacterium]|nr:glycosyltransferase [Gammaproteobacteria bacterium]